MQDIDPKCNRTARNTRRKTNFITKEMTVFDNTLKFTPIFNGKLASRKMQRQFEESHAFHQTKKSMQDLQRQVSIKGDDDTITDDQLLEVNGGERDQYHQKNIQKLLVTKGNKVIISKVQKHRNFKNILNTPMGSDNSDASKKNDSTPYLRKKHRGHQKSLNKDLDRGSYL